MDAQELLKKQSGTEKLDGQTYWITDIPNPFPFMEETPDTACGGGGILAHPIYSPINVAKQAINASKQDGS